MTNVALIEKPDRTFVTVRFAYDAGAVALLKDTVPGSLREYDPATKSWSVHQTCRDRLAEAMRAAGHTVTVGDEPPPPPKPSHYPPGVGGFFGIDADDGYVEAKALEIVESIPADRRGKVLRAISKLLYPDLFKRR